MATMSIASRDSKKLPMKEIIPRNWVIPKSSNMNGGKMANTQDRNSGNFTSYLSVCWKIWPWTTKEIKVVVTPMKTATKIIPSPKILLTPVRADWVVAGPVIPKINTINNA
jgi:hypothetical protein